MSAVRARAWAALSHERYEVAEREFRGVLTESPDDAEAHAALAIALAQLERLEEANREADTATALAPDSDFTHQVRGRILRDRNRFAEAKEAASEAVRLDPNDPNHRALLASIHIHQQQWADCLREADAGLALDPEHNELTNLRALSLTHLGRRDEAATAIAGALQRSPENSLTHTNQGWTLLHGNKPQAALEHFREALRLDPSNDWAREGLLTAIKARNPVFRMLLAYFLFMSRQRGPIRWAIILGVIFGQRLLRVAVSSHPEWGIVIYPLIALVAVFIYSTWLANPLMNLVMRFDRNGRHALTNDQFAQANLIGACLLLAAGLFGCEWWFGLSHLPSLMVLLLSIPLTTIHDADAGWPRRLCVIVSVALGAIVAFEVFALHLLHLAVMRRHFDSYSAPLAVAAVSLLTVYLVGIMVWSLLGTAWIVRVKPVK